jgi:2-methylisocitrate lyase-like PEP mutase family enzyme
MAHPTQPTENMQSIEARQRAEIFYRLHAGPGPLMLVNAWDAVSARVLERVGTPAIATTSAGMAWSLGYADGEQVPTGELIAACARIYRVASVPVSVDIERGFGRDTDEVCAVVRTLIGMGVVGVNIEDGVLPGTRRLAPPAVLCERIDALRKMLAQMDARLFINARIDTYVVANDEPAARYAETVRRAQLYASAGADGIFVPGLGRIEEVARFAGEVPLPVNIYAGYPGAPSVDALKRAGVRRVSLGCGPLQSTLGLLRRIAVEAFDEGSYAAMSGDMLSSSEVNDLFTPTPSTQPPPESMSR